MNMPWFPLPECLPDSSNHGGERWHPNCITHNLNASTLFIWEGEVWTTFSPSCIGNGFAKCAVGTDIPIFCFPNGDCRKPNLIVTEELRRGLNFCSPCDLNPNWSHLRLLLVLGGKLHTRDKASGVQTVHHGIWKHCRKFTGVPWDFSGIHFLSLLGAKILDYVKSCIIQDGSTWKSQEEEVTVKEGRRDHGKFGNCWIKTLSPDGMALMHSVWLLFSKQKVSMSGPMTHLTQLWVILWVNIPLLLGSEKGTWMTPF